MNKEETELCPHCNHPVIVSRVHNGVMWVGHGICNHCGWASQFAELLKDIEFEESITTE
jgi:hypothetical protein